MVNKIVVVKMSCCYAYFYSFCLKVLLMSYTLYLTLMKLFL